MITWNSLPDIFKVNLSFSMFKSKERNFLSRKILENIDAGRQYACIFFGHACNCSFSSVIVFGFGYCAVKFPIISFVVIIRIIRNVIVSWI